MAASALALSGQAHAERAPRDAAAERKIEEAIRYYGAGKYTEAEALLLGTLRACEDRCSFPVKARISMYLGIVRADGRKSSGLARQAFALALWFDPCVDLDEVLAQDPAKTLFHELIAPPPPPAEPKPEKAPTARFDDTDTATGEPAAPAEELPPAPTEPAPAESPRPFCPKAQPAPPPPTAPEPVQWEAADPIALEEDIENWEEDWDEEKLKHARYIDANTDRVVLFPTAETHPSGTFYFSSYKVIFLQMGYAVSDSVQFTLSGLPPVFTEDSPYLLDFSLKANVVRGAFQAALTAGLHTLGRTDSAHGDDAEAARFGAVGQACFMESCRSSLSFGFQSFHALDSDASLLALSMGLTVRAGDKIAFLAEPSLIAFGGPLPLAGVSYGIRISNPNVAADLTLIRPALELEFPLTWGFPFVVLTFRVGKEVNAVQRRADRGG